VVMMRNDFGVFVETRYATSCLAAIEGNGIYKACSAPVSDPSLHIALCASRGLKTFNHWLHVGLSAVVDSENPAKYHRMSEMLPSNR